MSEFRSDPWFAGFADGEGSFQLVRKYVGRPAVPVGYAPRFYIGLRADDVAILDALQREFGGRVRYDERRGERGNRNPRFGWMVDRKSDLTGLVDYFDRFPLRAKKRNDFAIWRMAVMIFVSRGARAAELESLARELVEGREYAAEVVQLRVADGSH